MTSDSSVSNSDYVSEGAAAQTAQDKAEEHVKREIAKHESKAVLRVRFLFFLVLAGSAIGVALGVYFYTSDVEDNEFRNQYESDAAKILQSIGDALDNTLSATDNFAAAIVAQKEANTEFPFVKMPNFPIQAAKLKTLAKAFSVGVQYLVSSEQRTDWEAYAKANNEFVYETWELQEQDESFQASLEVFPNIQDELYVNFPEFTVLPPDSGPHLVSWQQYPLIYEPFGAAYNFDFFAFGFFSTNWLPVLEEKRPSISKFTNLVDPTQPVTDPAVLFGIAYVENLISKEENAAEPFVSLIYPIIDQQEELRIDLEKVEDDELVGSLSFGIFWRDLLRNILPEKSEGILVVTENTCGDIFTYEINGAETVYLGNKDFHNPKYEGSLEKVTTLEDLMNSSGKGGRKSSYTGIPLTSTVCPISIRIYPSEKNEGSHTSSNPIFFTIAAGLIFVFAGVMFLVYDTLVERRQDKVSRTAAKSSAIVSSLFPEEVRERLFRDDEESGRGRRGLGGFANKANTANTVSNDKKGVPVADLYPECTVMFSDIKGFTAWSSVRDPTQVFVLLEALYGAFDKIANMRGVFKVETIGDSYVAVAGLPEARKDHAVIMARFARDCRDKSNSIFHAMEVTLGPGTAALGMRFGLHSGPVTAGVLRGERARFQLFGDTVNTAARMESTGVSGKIQCTHATAERLLAAGKDNWTTKRSDKIEVKGKGTMETYWIYPKTADTNSNTSTSDHTSTSSGGDRPESHFDERLSRWHVENLSNILKRIIARRSRSGSPSRSMIPRWTSVGSPGSTVIDEAVDTISFLEAKSPSSENDLGDLSPQVQEQLQAYVTAIQSMYHGCSFHNFEHASHVTMSMVKMLHHLGIDMDPLTEFACVFSTLIHDVDHPGVSNQQLISERTALASVYMGKSISEQNSVDLAWNLMLDDKYTDLRAAICGTAGELVMFRQLVVNCVMATDVMDPLLNQDRTKRWNEVFQESSAADTSMDRRATLVLEHAIQTADIAHTMQHWHIYRKWNERLFVELYSAFRTGRMAKDPCDFWYKGELAFFDKVVIPLAQKMSDCGMTGGLGIECLDYARQNRSEWEQKGQEILESMIQQYVVE